MQFSYAIPYKKLLYFMFITGMTFSCQNSGETDAKRLEVSSHDRDLSVKQSDSTQVSGSVDSLRFSSYEERRRHKADSQFRAYVIKEIIKDSSELKYVVDVEDLYSVKCVEYDSVSIHYLDTVDGQRVELYIKVKPFEPENHQMKFKEFEEERDYNDCEEIDGYFPWGGYYGCPRKEIEKVSIKINGVRLANRDYFKYLYDIDIEVDTYIEFFDPNPSLKYDIESKNFHFYILGGNAAGSYFAKIVFSEIGILKKYVLSYYQLVTNGSSRKSFKGF